MFVGLAGVGPWQEQEIYGFLHVFVARRSAVIPVLLDNAPSAPDLPIFLRAMTYVDFRLREPDPLVRLEWGIPECDPTTPECGRARGSGRDVHRPARGDVLQRAPASPVAANGSRGASCRHRFRRRSMATNQPHTKRDQGGQGGQSDKQKAKGGYPAKDQPGQKSQGSGSKGKNDSGGNK